MKRFTYVKCLQFHLELVRLTMLVLSFYGNFVSNENLGLSYSSCLQMFGRQLGSTNSVLRLVWFFLLDWNFQFGN